MTLEQYVQALNDYLQSYPDIKDAEVIVNVGTDNHIFDTLSMPLTVGNYDFWSRDFTPWDNFPDCCFALDEEINAVCISII